jgi:hypothetical protein
MASVGVHARCVASASCRAPWRSTKACATDFSSGGRATLPTSPGGLPYGYASRPIWAGGREPDGYENHDYCHPRAIIVKRLTNALGGPGSRSIHGFAGERCDRARPSDWIDVPSSNHLWATERDGDVVLTTTGDGTFVRR